MGKCNRNNRNKSNATKKNCSFAATSDKAKLEEGPGWIPCHRCDGVMRYCLRRSGKSVAKRSLGVYRCTSKPCQTYRSLSTLKRALISNLRSKMRLPDPILRQIIAIVSSDLRPPELTSSLRKSSSKIPPNEKTAVWVDAKVEEAVEILRSAKKAITELLNEGRQLSSELLDGISDVNSLAVLSGCLQDGQRSPVVSQEEAVKTVKTKGLSANVEAKSPSVGKESTLSQTSSLGGSLPSFETSTRRISVDEGFSRGSVDSNGDEHSIIVCQSPSTAEHNNNEPTFRSELPPPDASRFSNIHIHRYSANFRVVYCSRPYSMRPKTTGIDLSQRGSNAELLLADERAPTLNTYLFRANNECSMEGAIGAENGCEGTAERSAAEVTFANQPLSSSAFLLSNGDDQFPASPLHVAPIVGTSVFDLPDVPPSEFSAGDFEAMQNF